MHTAAVVVAPAIVGATEHTKGKRGIRSQSGLSFPGNARRQKWGIAAVQIASGHWMCLVGAAGFEPTTPCPPDKCANRAAPRPDRNGTDYRTVRACCSDYRIRPHVATLSLSGPDSGFDLCHVRAIGLGVLEQVAIRSNLMLMDEWPITRPSGNQCATA